MSNRFDPTFVRSQTDMLRLRSPEIWGDLEDRLLALESETNLTEFLDRAVEHMQDAQAAADGLANLIADLRIRRDNYLTRVDAMRELMFKLMSVADVRKLELLRATLSIRAGTSKVIITDEAALPEHCIRVKREPDKKAIRDAIECNVPVPGATLSNAEDVLNVRVK